MPPRSAPFFGRRVVAAAFVLAMFGWGIGFYGPSALLHAVRETRGWSIALVSGAVTVHFLFGAVVVANLPRLYDRFGVPTVTKAGAAALALGILGWALAQTPLQLVAAALVSGAGWVAMGAAAVNAIIAPWFVAKRPAALSMAYNGASIGGVVFSPLLTAAIARIGFAPAALLIAVTMVAVVWLLADRVFSRTPEAMGQAPDGVEQTATRTDRRAAPAIHLVRLRNDRRFASLTAAMALSLFAQAGLIAHLVSLMVMRMSADAAGLMMALATASAIAGRTLVGWLMPPGADRRLVASASLAVQIAGALVLAGGGGTAAVLTGVVLFGLGIGNATSLPPLIAQVEFGADAQRAVALIVAISQATYAFAPLAFGLVRTLTDASGVFLAAAAIEALAAAALMLGRGARRPEGAARASKP
ncbi:putative MFS family arabinose efflux permease [Chelatococcus caeni]|uniref:Putative MFS family arabinose efflux permease n=1 Tax=Chelatococcus caeni TaxID=1348468 RepID=A0A840C2L0_9HYPH|nr:MFS transporter [Chelatococcus caeni]MBB4019053.1 putative MFS family arabinose efflux permease [Chelatococcus caeni]